MALYPTIFAEAFHDPFFDEFFHDSGSGRSTTTTMNTIRSARCDVKEYDDRCDIEAELPGYAKEDVTVSLNDNTLMIEAKKNTEDNLQDENGRYIRRERYYGKLRRAFSVGRDVQQEDISASFKDGILTVSIAKHDPEIEKKQHYIAIEG